MAGNDEIPSRDAKQPRFARWIPAAVLAAAYAWFLLGHSLPTDLDATNDAYLTLAYIGFLERTFELHLAIALIVFAAAAFALRRRDVAYAALPLLVVLLAVTGLVERITWAGGHPPDRPALRVMTANVLGSASHHDDLAEEIRRHDPDVIAFQEFTPVWHRELRERIGSRYPHVLARPAPGVAGSAIYSKRPFAATDEQPLGFGRTPLRVVVRHERRPVAIYGLHPPPPRPLAGFRLQRRMLGALIERLKREELSYVVAGDFNFTANSPHADKLQEELSVGDALDKACRGRCATWPMRGLTRLVPSLGIRIDHVFVSGNLAVLHAQIGDAGDSDHRPVIVDLDWPDSSVD